MLRFYTQGIASNTRTLDYPANTRHSFIGTISRVCWVYHDNREGLAACIKKKTNLNGRVDLSRPLFWSCITPRRPTPLLIGDFWHRGGRPCFVRPAEYGSNIDTTRLHTYPATHNQDLAYNVPPCDWWQRPVCFALPRPAFIYAHITISYRPIHGGSGSACRGGGGGWSPGWHYLLNTAHTGPALAQCWGNVCDVSPALGHRLPWWHSNTGIGCTSQRCGACLIRGSILTVIRVSYPEPSCAVHDIIFVSSSIREVIIASSH